MTTLTELRQHIEEESRKTLGSVGDRHVQDAIRHYARKRWWFNDISASFNTADGTETYSFPTGFYKIEKLTVEITSGYPTPLEQVTWQRLEELRTTSTYSSGVPYIWSHREQQIYLYSIPNQVWQVNVSGWGAASVTVTDDSSPWSNEAYELIKNRSRATIERDYFLNPDGYRMFAVAEAEALAKLENDNNRMLASGKLRGHDY